MESNVTPEGTPVDPGTAISSVDSSAVASPAKKSKVRRNVLLAGSAVGLVGIGSTLAANISLNGGNNVEFGQGVAKTTACDEDGFTINPVTSYDTTNSIFRIDRVEISGLNLTPVGTGYGAAGYNSQSDAKTAHPGEYFDPTANSGDGDWIRTCDGVVLDFKAFTDDITYWSSTRDGYNTGDQTTTSPVGWIQLDGNPNLSNDKSYGPSGYVGNRIGNFGFAVIFDINDDNSGFVSNWGSGDWGSYGSSTGTFWENLDRTDLAHSSFSFRSESNYRPDAASISKITVSSMAHFPSMYHTPSDYYLDNDSGIGVGS
jgi:hypothetical protein